MIPKRDLWPFDYEGTSKKEEQIPFLAGLPCYLAGGCQLYQTHKKIPENLNYRSEEYRVGENGVDFLYDLTYESNGGTIELDQSIFDTLFNLIENAERYILIDMFLFNSMAPTMIVFIETYQKNCQRGWSERSQETLA